MIKEKSGCRKCKKSGGGEKQLSDAEEDAAAQEAFDEMWIHILDKQIKHAEALRRKRAEAMQSVNAASTQAFFAIDDLHTAQRGQVGFSLEELASRARFSARDQAMFGGSGQIGPAGSPMRSK